MDATNITNGYERICKMGGGNHPIWPDSYKTCVQYLHEVDFDTHNAVEHKMISAVWNSLFYKTWLHFRKTYILDVDFFTSLTKIKSVKIYPSVLRTLPFNTFSVDLSGSDIFNGYILCSFDVTDKGIYCSFLTNSYEEDDNSNNKNKQFGIFLDVSDMEYDENGELYFDLSKDTEENSDISFYRKPNLVDTFKNIFNAKIYRQYKKNEKINPVLGPDFMHENDGEVLAELEEEYFANLKDVNEDTKWFLLKKALIQFAYYLCTPEPDIYETNETKRNIKRAEKLRKNMDNIEYKYTIGSRVGARIRLGRVASNDIGEAVEYSKGTMKCPHIRAAHWTHVWCGSKDNQHIEPRFIEVTFINYSLGNIDEVCNEVSDRVRQNWEGENLVCRTLDALGLKYKRQSPIVVDNRRYRFDVEVRIDGKLRYIEYDGEQHFRPVSIFGGQEGFSRTREADIVKNNYCYQNDIPLLRISYKNKGDIDKFVRNFVNDEELYQFRKNTESMYYSA